jgi:hypothetical protein
LDILLPDVHWHVSAILQAVSGPQNPIPKSGRQFGRGLDAYHECGSFSHKTVAPTHGIPVAHTNRMMTIGDVLGTECMRLQGNHDCLTFHSPITQL